jgi:fibronectin-binding autotransporter adhesin
LMKKAAIFFILFLIFASFVCGQAIFTWTGTGGDTNWDEPDNWLCNYLPYNGVNYPGENVNDIVIINDNAAVILNVNALNLDSLTIDDNASLDLAGFSLTVNSLNLINGAELAGNLVADNITIDDTSILNNTINFSSGDGALTIASGIVYITGTDIVCGNLDLDSRDINVTQSGVGGAIAQLTSTVIKTSGKLSLSAEGTIELTEANEVAKLEITKADRAVEFTNNAALEVVGVTANDDVTITIDHSTNSITISGDFSAKDLTIINTGTGDVQIGNADINLTGNFDIKNTKLTLDGSGATSIKAVDIDAGSIDVTSAGIININAANITTTGNQNYGNGTVTLTGTTTLTGKSGSITANGKVTGTGVTFNALHGISLTNAANALAGNITLDNTQSGIASGNITFKNTSTLTSLTAKNNTANGNITINQTGNLPIDSLQTTGAGGSISIEAGGAVTQTGAITTSALTVEAGTGITLAQTNAVTTSVDLTSTAGNINFVNTHGGAGNLSVTAAANNGNVTIKENTGGLVVGEIDAVGKIVSLDAAGSITQMPATEIKAGALTVVNSASITLDLVNEVTASVDFKSTGNINFTNKLGSAGNLSVKTDTTGNITIKEESGGLNVDEIDKGANIDLKAHTDVRTEGITVSGSITMEAGRNITVTDGISFSGSINSNNKVTLEANGKITVTDVTAYQLIAIAAGDVTVKTVKIHTSNNGDEGKSAAIYIEADDFKITAAQFSSPYSIVPGGTGGQLCLNLDKKWEDTGDFVDGCEDGDPLGTSLDVRWHQHFIDLSGRHLVYGDGILLPDDYDPAEYIIIENNNNKTKFILSPDCHIYIYDADITTQNNTGLMFETSGEGIIEFKGTNKFTNLTLKADTDITLENINTLSDITVETSGTIIINQNIVTTGKQEYSGEVALVNAVTLTSTSTDESITLGNIAGNSKSLTIAGNSILNGGSGIENLSVNGTATINANIETTGTQEYKGAVTLGSGSLITLEGATVTLGHIIGSGKSLKVIGDGVLNGGSGIHDLSVTGTATINADITTTTGTQTYGAVTLTGTGTRTLTGTIVTLGQFTGPGGTGLSLTIAGGGVLKGGSGIGVLSVSGTTAINGNITTMGTQTYTEAVTLGGTGDLITLQGTTLTLGTITGGGKSLTITGIGVLNGGSGINDLSVTGTATINADITTAGNQTYTGAATLHGTNKRIINSQNGNIGFKSTLGVADVTKDIIELSAASGNITITGKTTAYRLIAKASSSTGIVKVSAIAIDSSNTGNDGDNAAIYIVANEFDVTTTTPNSIVPGGTGGQLCLNLNKKWTNTNNVVDGPEDDPVGTIGARWHQHFMVVGKILYSFTEDSNGNGKLDRIRVQTNKELKGSFDGFEVSIKEGYKVDKNKPGTDRGYVLVSSDDYSFYIYLEEKAEFDGDKIPQWEITKNTSLIDATHNPISSDLSEMKYIDTIPPRIVYTLTLPGHPQTYVQISEPVQTSAGANISAGDITFNGRTVTAVKGENLGYLFEYSTSYKVEDLVGLNNIDSATNSLGYFQMNNIVDKGKKLDSSEIDPNYPPKYPTDWSYTSYASSGALVPPNKLIGVMSKTDNDPVIRRVTDVLVSLSPNNYFVLPVWAKPSSDNNSIMEFDGSKYLEKDSIEKSGIEMQARISNNLTITPQLFWTTADIPANMRNPKEASDAKKTGGLWLPSDLTNPLYYYVPLSNGINQTSAANSSSPLFNYDIAADKLANSGAKFEFIFRSLNTSDLFIARLDAPTGVIPSNWYTLVRPFSFNVQGIRYQRGGVTILNNVINSDNKETAYIRYELPRAGRVTIQIYTLDGTVVKSIRRNENREAGAYVDSWDGSNNGGRAVARGMYFVRVVGPDIDEIRKIMVVK